MTPPGDLARSLSPRDPRLPRWGPYSKRYLGVSHVADEARGTRWDVTIVPALFRGAFTVADGLSPCGVHPSQASPGLGRYSYHYRLDGEGELTCEVTFTAVSESARLVTARYHNPTDRPLRVVTHAVGHLDFARIGPHKPPLATESISAPGATWVDALDYDEASLSKPGRDAGLIADGLMIAESRAHHSIGGSVVRAGPSGAQRLSYAVRVPEPAPDALLRLRYRHGGDQAAPVTVTGAIDRTLELAPSEQMAFLDVPIGGIEPETLRLEISFETGDGAADVEFDGFLLGTPDAVGGARVTADPLDDHVDAEAVDPGGAVLTPVATPQSYGLSWARHGGHLRTFRGEELAMLLAGAKYDAAGLPSQSNLASATTGRRFTDLLTEPTLVPPRSSVRVHGLLCDGPPEQVREQLHWFAGLTQAERESLAEVPGEDERDERTNSGAADYLSSQQKMAATVLTNVVYPTYVRRHHVRHFTPGRWWDSLYTWDSGFIGLGLVELDPPRAADTLAAYVTAPNDPHSAFIHHGTPLPTQQYLAAELLSRGHLPEYDEQWYRALRAQYRFLSGSDPRSATRLPSGLINTFAHFYNSGGWDDYPAQAYVHAHQLSSRAGPMVSASHAIRVAKLLWLSSSAQQNPEQHADDHSSYLQDIESISEAVQRCWDTESGYFGYGLHDDDGTLTGVIRNAEGANVNMGLDGVYPLMAGATTPDQTQILTERLFDPSRMWTPHGISAVDQSAPYFGLDGYWNGSVWMPHQWFVYKTMLDLGRPDLAHRIAATALDVWARETDRNGDCFEHFSIATGQGSGWHQFGGLSSPVLNFFASLHRPGTLTTGLETLTTDRDFAADATSLRATLHSVPGASAVMSVIACMAPGQHYQATIDGHSAPVADLGDGTLGITWARGEQDPSQVRRRSLEIVPAA